MNICKDFSELTFIKKELRPELSHNTENSCEISCILYTHLELNKIFISNLNCREFNSPH